MSEHTQQVFNRVSTGVEGLDTILAGGLPRERIFMIRGEAGTGKTTLAMQFLLEGVKNGEQVLYMTLLQDRSELEDTARGHGWSLKGMDIFKLPDAVRAGQANEQTVFSPAEVELHEAIDAIITRLESSTPDRVVIDSISELAILVDSHFQLRRQLLRLRYVLARKSCTTIFVAGDIGELTKPLLTLANGVIELSRKIPDYGPAKRKLEVMKVRGLSYLEGMHDGRIGCGGWRIFPRLVPGTGNEIVPSNPRTSGVPELDQLLGGGMEAGTSCLIAGTTGAGKSTIAALYMAQAAAAGEKSVCFCFDERRETFIYRSNRLFSGITEYVRSGLIDVRQVDVGDLSPGELVHEVIGSVEKDGVKLVVIDSLTGYLNAMPNEHLLITQLHELLGFLSNHGVLSISILTTHGLFGRVDADIDVSYVADTVMLARHFEAGGSLRRCLSVVKKRHGVHEKTIRELDICAEGVRIGEPLTAFSGVLTGVPNYHGGESNLLAVSEGLSGSAGRNGSPRKSSADTVEVHPE